MKQSKGIEELNGCLRIFEIFGMQFFSLNSVFQRKSAKHWSIWRIIHFGVFCAIGLGCACSVIHSSFNLEKVTTKNVLSIFFLHLVNHGYVLAVFASLVQSAFFVRETKQFFLNSQEIAEICYKHFNIEMNFRKFRYSSFRKIYFTLVFILLTFLGHLKARGIPIDEIKLAMILALILATSNLMIACKYSFYVSFINFELSHVEKLLRLTFETKPSPYIIKVSSVEFAKNPAREHLRKLNKMWLIYNKICENESIVNRSNGMAILLTLIVSVMILTYQGFEFCVSLMNGAQFQNTIGKQ